MAARIPLATYRIQLRREFDFDALRARLPYLVALGVTDVYVSPILQATPGSTHGYDVIDPTRISDDLGGADAFRRLSEELRRLGLGLIVDIVPNHMGVADGANLWWEDVLRHGRGSHYAPVFDIDWDVPDPAVRGRVLLAILGDSLDAVLARGEIGVEEAEDGARLRYYDRVLPLAPGTLETTGWRATDLHARRTSPEGIEVLHDLLDAQHYRLVFWREGKPQVNARRFFEIDTLIGVRQEDPQVFDLTHAKIIELVRTGAITGLRIDHIDGLADPAGYLERLRVATGGDADGATGAAVYTVVEKILARDEALPEGWATHGTTGYDFLNEVNGLFIDHEQEGAIVAAYRRLTGREEPYLDIAFAARREIIDGALAGRFAVTIERLRTAAAPAFADIDAAAFDEAVRALLASLPVYRTYHTPETPDPGAPSALHAAMAAARAAAPGLDPVAVDAARRLLSTPPAETLEAVLALQQLMPAVAAKGLEDCALYRYIPLASANAVGSAPDQSSESSGGFHAMRAEQHRRWPATMTTLATHDHKRGPDMRARLNVLTEVADDWGAAVEEWHALNRSGATPPIHRHDEYTLYQTLVGCWPPGAAGGDAEFAERIREYTVKAAREAGERTAWIGGDEAYEAALGAFVTRILDPARSGAFLEQLAAFVARIAPAGAVSGLAMLALQIAAPGVPDVYQGRERWDFGLVDPDNRRAVDYVALEAFLDALPPPGPGDAEIAAGLLADWPGGAVKQYVLARMLRARQAAPALFLEGDYVPIEVQGTRAAQVVAFARATPQASALVAVPRLSMSLTRPGEASWWSPAWGDTALTLPATLPARPFRDAFTGVEVIPTAEGTLRLDDVLGRFPVALLL
ncbi:MAG: malto-oligosyltrehalose synthase [Dehalococcoidia bacterium]